MVTRVVVGVIQKTAEDWKIKLSPQELEHRCRYTCHEIEYNEKHKEQHQQ